MFTVQLEGRRVSSARVNRCPLRGQGVRVAGKTAGRDSLGDLYKVKTIGTSGRWKNQSRGSLANQRQSILLIAGRGNNFHLALPSRIVSPRLMNTKRGDLSWLIRGILIINCATNIYKRRAAWRSIISIGGTGRLTIRDNVSKMATDGSAKTRR